MDLYVGLTKPVFTSQLDLIKLVVQYLKTGLTTFQTWSNQVLAVKYILSIEQSANETSAVSSYFSCQLSTANTWIVDAGVCTLGDYFLLTFLLISPHRDIHEIREVYH